MEKPIVNKMSLYDILTLILPSAFVCYAWNGAIFSSGDTSWVSYVAQLGAMLMVGVVLKSISTWWAGLWFRNHTGMIKEAKENKTTNLLDMLHTFVCTPFLYLISIISNKYYKQDKDIIDQYYAQYKIAYNNAYSGKRMEFLENQVAFIQTWSWALGFCLFGEFTGLLGCTAYHLQCKWWLVVIGIYVCIVAMTILQKKIYQVVWEASDATDGSAYCGEDRSKPTTNNTTSINKAGSSKKSHPTATRIE